jgi:hypothetical protein
MTARPFRPIAVLALWAASGCGGPRVPPPPPPNPRVPIAAAAASGPTDAAPATAGPSVRTVYVEEAPFTNKTTVEVVGVSPTCHEVLVEVACAPPVLLQWEGYAPSPVCPALALDAIDLEHGALRERWISSQATARYFTRYDDVEGGRPVAPPGGFKDVTRARCDDAHPASTFGAALERAAAHDERRIRDSSADPDTVVVRSPGRRFGARLRSSADDPDALVYSLLDLASGRICKTARVDANELDSFAAVLSDDAILWITRQAEAAPLVVDLVSGRAVALDSPPRTGERGAVYAAMRAGPGIARSAAAFWIDGGHAVTTRVTDDARTAVVLVDALALLPEARARSGAAGCAP